MTRLLAIAGSLRKGSFNRKVLALAVDAAKKQGAEVDVLDLKLLALPVYDGDDELTAYPPGATDFKARAQQADAILVCSPEYNNSIPGGLKNAIDWVSRPPPSNPFKGKPVALMSATMSGYGAPYTQLHLRQVFTSFGCILVPESVRLSRAQDAFDDSGALKDPRNQQQVELVVAALLKLAQSLSRGT